MKVSFKEVDGPQSFDWEDIPVGVCVQNVVTPSNLLIKASSNTGLRVNPTNGYKVGTTQNPGCKSRWYKCEMEISIKPVVGF